MSGEERRVFVELIDAAVRELIDTRRYCRRCTRWMARDEFGPGNHLCRPCVALRVLDYRERRKAQAA